MRRNLFRCLYLVCIRVKQVICAQAIRGQLSSNFLPVSRNPSSENGFKHAPKCLHIQMQLWGMYRSALPGLSAISRRRSIAATN